MDPRNSGVLPLETAVVDYDTSQQQLFSTDCRCPSVTELLTRMAGAGDKSSYKMFQC